MTTLFIKDLSLDKELDRATMSTVRGGLANQANGTSQANNQAMFAPVSVANCASFGGAPVNIQVDSTPTQYAYNDSTSSNSQSEGWASMFPAFY